MHDLQRRISRESAPARSALTREERDALLQKYDALNERLVAGTRQRSRLPEEELGQLRGEYRRARGKYYARLPRVGLSRCPFCASLLMRSFDPWGLDGLWWQQHEGGPAVEPQSCPHFRVLTGALHLNGLPPMGGRKPSWPGPEVPYVIDRILNMVSMVAVIAAVPLANGYVAFPMAYFSERAPEPGSLTQSWTRPSYGYVDAAGRSRWVVRTDRWNFDMRAWAERGKLRWIDPVDPGFHISRVPPAACPFLDIPGLREQLVIEGDQVSTRPAPDEESVEHFDL
jgi:hypothetical protein